MPEKSSAEEVKDFGEIVKIDEEKIQSHLDTVIRGTVEETLNALLEEEAKALCNAARYERKGSKAQDAGRGLLPGRSFGADAGMCPAAPRVRHEVGTEAIYEHGTAQGSEGGRRGGGMSFAV